MPRSALIEGTAASVGVLRHTLSPFSFPMFSGGLQVRLRKTLCAEATPLQRGGDRWL